MDWLHVVVLALIQGLTEFLPISSSAHLLFPHLLLGWPDEGLAFDVAVHVGSLVAVVVYLRRELLALVAGAWHSACGRSSAEGTLAWTIALATIPCGLAGLLLDDWIESNLRSLWVIGVTTLLFGLLLGVADRHGGGGRTTVDWRTGLLVGLSQVVALVPGTSRSGITMTAGLLLGLDRTTSARFSFLLSIPLIVAAGGYKALELATGGAPVDWFALIAGALVSGVAAFSCIHLFMKLLDRIGFMPFVVYRVVLGLGLLGWSAAATLP